MPFPVSSLCLLLVDQDVSSQLLLQCHACLPACLPATMLPAMMIMDCLGHGVSSQQ
ncbi:hypothetical protein T09_4325 [Trichinella sp. T9]|nr:hypothetical protein T09_4325 [Trichinella sp. T9]